MNRYARQQQVPQLGAGSQQALNSARVLLVGAGGLGSPIANLLVGAGVGQITLVDFDTIDISNLHRQTLYTEADVGASKVFVAQQRLQALNSDVCIKAVNEPLNINNASALIPEHTIVVDAADSFLVSYLLSDLCLQHSVPLVSASVLQTSGYVGVFCGGGDFQAPSLRAVFPSPPLTAQTCSTAGVTGPSVNTIGAIQAQEVLKVIVGDKAQLNGKVLYLDLWNYQQNIVDFSHALEPEKFAPLIAQTDIQANDIVLDVRSAQEFKDSPRDPNEFSHLDHNLNLINMPVDQLKLRQHELSKAHRLVCVCKSGQRALNAAHQLVSFGFGVAVLGE